MLDNENRNCNCNNGYAMNNNNNMMVENTDYPNTTAASAGFSNNTSNNNCCSQNTMNSIPMYSYEFTNINEEETCSENEITRDEMIQKIRSLDFACVELAQYLDTHVDDEKALYLHRKYCTELRDLKDKYQKVYGPLNIYCPCNKWRWLEEPWPWERGNF